jgi:hypothetical protein
MQVGNKKRFPRQSYSFRFVQLFSHFLGLKNGKKLKKNKKQQEYGDYIKKLAFQKAK